MALITAAQPHATWLERQHDFGVFLEKDGKVTCHMRLVNTGNEALFITKAQAGCGCTGISYTEEPILPGDTATGFTSARNKSTEGDKDYGGRISKSVAKMEKDERKGVSPDTVAKLICSIAAKRKVKPLYTAGLDYKLIIVLLKILPYSLSNKLISLLYG